MLQKLELQQLQALSLAELKAQKDEASKRKTALEALKAKSNKSWTQTMQDELDDLALYIVDIDDAIEEKQNEATSTAENQYVVKPGTEKMVHLSLVRGRRFNPLTGKEESKVFTQLFTFAEWQLFKNNFKGLGYTIMAALHDPYGDAAELVTKN
jgi:dGTP triphosphohydrolase